MSSVSCVSVTTLNFCQINKPHPEPLRFHRKDCLEESKHLQKVSRAILAR